MNGWIRQKCVWVPGLRFVDVDHVIEPEAGVPAPSGAESSAPRPFASG